MLVKKFLIKDSGTNSRDYPAGTVCYNLMQHDYGLASDDTGMLACRTSL